MPGLLWNKKRTIMACILPLLVLSMLHAWEQDDYSIKNISGEDLLLTVRYSGRRWYRLNTYERNEINRIPLPAQEPNQDLVSFSLFICEPEINDGIRPGRLYNQTRLAKRMLVLVISEIVIHDMEGNIVLTIDDIQEDDFAYNDQRQSPCIMVTQEMVQTGRIKYAAARDTSSLQILPCILFPNLGV